MDTSHVFVSHSSSDAAVVRKLREALEPHGVHLWIDRRELAPGDDLDPEIRTAIDESAHVIVILSLEALKSAWVEKEVDYAREARAGRDGFRLIPVLRPPFEPSMTKRLLGEDLVAISLGEEPGAFDQAVAEILVALGYELREDASEGGLRAEPQNLSHLVLHLSEPEIREEEGTRRAAARAYLVFQPADPAARPVESHPFRFVAPLGPIEADDLAWYLERYSAWPSEHFQERAPSSRSSVRFRTWPIDTERSSPSCSRSSTVRAIRSWRRRRGFIIGMPSRWSFYWSVWVEAGSHYPCGRGTDVRIKGAVRPRPEGTTASSPGFQPGAASRPQPGAAS